ncbi:TetR family transcriptional regulator [Leifsonia sp. WHRI 6310E]|uniref:TetR/AcrR family transcriptional regulator n=1 Tax=Leifsonia sp. WHRI 6310E TaxID=3162562 RepID=UPI0032EB1AC9
MVDSSPGEARRPRRHDPARRDRIIDACLDVIAERGVAGTTHRRVAEAADVPLGSMTYHFTGMDALLAEAFDRFARAFSTGFEASMAECASAADAREALAHHILHEVFGTPRELVLTQELYTLAARDPRYRTITNGWMGRSRAVLERFFDPVTAGILDALVEGMTLHRALDVDPYDASAVRTAIDRVAGGAA